MPRRHVTLRERVLLLGQSGTVFRVTLTPSDTVPFLSWTKQPLSPIKVSWTYVWPGQGCLLERQPGWQEVASQAHRSQDSLFLTERSDSWLKSSAFVPLQGSGARGTGPREKRNHPTRVSWERQRPQQVPSCFTRDGTGPPRRNIVQTHRHREPNVLHRDKDQVPKGRLGRATWQRCPRITESRIRCYFLGSHFKKIMKKLKGHESRVSWLMKD